MTKQSIQISVDRSRLSAGDHEAQIILSGIGVISKAVRVRVKQDVSGGADVLEITNANVSYSRPYLIDFSFSLKDEGGRSVVAEPSAFNVTAREGDTTVSELETGVHLKRAAALPLKMMLVLDYTLSMQNIEGAIENMEDAAKNELLPALNQDAQVGIVEFHREDPGHPPALVAPFTVDRAYLRNRIDAIQPQYVQGFASASVAWDALVYAAQQFDDNNAQNEARYIVFFSDGNDTSSTNSLSQAIAAANARDIRVYAVGFSSEVNLVNMLELSSRTGGAYFPADSVAQLGNTIRSIVEDLEGQYILRWASLRRNTLAFRPSFTIEVAGDSATHTASETFVPTQYTGDVLKGRLRIEASDSVNNTTAFLRAQYMPRFIREMRIYVESDYDFTVSRVPATSDGLAAGWSMDVTDAGLVAGGKWIELSTTGEAIPFGTFGPILRFEFEEIIEDPDALVNHIYVDNTIYDNGQYFSVEGYANAPPTGL